jgi:hypothetical protein
VSLKRNTIAATGCDSYGPKTILLGKLTVCMKTLPREHGLTVSWILMIAGALLLSSDFHTYGIGLTVVLLPTLFAYDRLIVSMRLWSIGKMETVRMLLERVGARVLILLSITLVYAVAGLLLHLMPSIPVLVTASILLLDVLAYRYLKERHIITRALSILTVTSQFLLINSALSGGVTSFEIIAFVLISLMNLLLVANVVQYVETTNISKGLSGKGSLGVDLPFFVIGVGIAAAISLAYSAYYLSFVVLLIAVQAVFRLAIQGRSMRTIGAFSSTVDGLAILLLLVRFYAVL